MLIDVLHAPWLLLKRSCYDSILSRPAREMPIFLLFIVTNKPKWPGSGSLRQNHVTSISNGLQVFAAFKSLTVSILWDIIGLQHGYQHF